jgi:hypothetical protein
MLETLYKTICPELGKSECYELLLRDQPGTALQAYTFREDHGWWDECTKTFIHHATTFGTTEKGVAFEVAAALYVEARNRLARSGFVHSFTPDFYRDKPLEYRLLKTA